MFESWANRRKSVRLVAEVVGDRQGKISRSKVVVMFKTLNPSHIGLTTRLRPTCERKMLESWANRRKNVRLVAEVMRLVAEVVGDRHGKISRSMVDGHVQNFKPAIRNRLVPMLLLRLVVVSKDWSYGRSHDATIYRAIYRCTRWIIVPSVFGCHDLSYDRSQDATIARTIGHRIQRSIDRTIGRRPSRLIVHRSLIATTSRTIPCDGSCHRYSPIVRDSATTRRDRSRYATDAGDRSKHCRSVAPWPDRNQ